MARRQEEIENSFDFMQTVKGLIAVLITILVVVVFVMLFAKSLFDSSSTTPVKTGKLTSQEYTYVPTTTNEEVTATTTQKKKKKTTAEEEEPSVSLPEGLDTSIAGNYSVTAAVYLHPEPSSSSENLLTLPAGATVKVYGSTNYGWYYLEYDGQYGYAWSSGYLSAQ